MFFRSDRIRSMSESKLSMVFEADTRYDVMLGGSPVFTGKLVDIRGSKAYFQSNGVEKVIDFQEDVGYTFRKVLPFYIG